ncbi:flagellar basal-body rod protein FlgF [Psychromonas ingrahamii 37]|uniref:Flagellar basal-body rod protein FlgF n=1 Tax=Psychromonas ingrahamii (strain DSM 17664 / CCUG 51855 / 37) TaxID=357804 RepID=A1T0J2_PSYIN|nr:flagellar basal body rod protein FlgF [Psychromonas ingrahamii]ABM05257.1 flagellar basal-body rod protein FlgF [Psychromonas ingrahamii 37]
MNPILFTAATSASKLMISQHVRANNMAQVNTIGFKAVLERTVPVFRTGDGFLSSVTSRSNSTSIDFSHGKLSQTGRPLDVAITGDGFFAVRGNDGKESYTRAGNIKASADGELSVNNNALLGTGGEQLVLPEHQSLTISNKGIITVMSNGGGASIEVGQIKLVNPDTNKLTLNTSGTFSSAVPLEASPDVEMTSEYLESANVSVISEMIGVMTATRQYEMQVKMMKAADQLIAAGNKLISARG